MKTVARMSQSFSGEDWRRSSRQTSVTIRGRRGFPPRDCGAGALERLPCPWTFRPGPSIRELSCNAHPLDLVTAFVVVHQLCATRGSDPEGFAVPSTNQCFARTDKASPKRQFLDCNKKG